MALLAPRDGVVLDSVGPDQGDPHYRQNTSHAVMAQRIEPADSADLFPTPPWATRALVEWLGQQGHALCEQTCWEPACGLGHMSNVLADFFCDVRSSDAINYGWGHENIDFADPSALPEWLWPDADWIITNPPFKLAEEFSRIAIRTATRGVAMLVRTTFIEGVKRHRDLFSVTPPSYVLQFVERVPMHRGRLEANGSTATAYAWLVWDKSDQSRETKLRWLPPCRKRLERAADYTGSV